jgi:hypothetical protein
MCLYLHFLHFDTYKSLVKRRTLIKRRIKQGRSRPVPQSVCKLESLELKVLWQFLGHDPPINCRRTLDQFGYPGLLDTRARDDDQMLYKMTKQRSYHPKDNLYDYDAEKKANAGEKTQGDGEENLADGDNDEDSDESESGSEEESDEDILDGNVLMVDQVWLWIVDKGMLLIFPTASNTNVSLSGTILTFFPRVSNFAVSFLLISILPREAHLQISRNKFCLWIEKNPYSLNNAGRNFGYRRKTISASGFTQQSLQRSQRRSDIKMRKLF